MHACMHAWHAWHAWHTWHTWHTWIQTYIYIIVYNPVLFGLTMNEAGMIFIHSQFETDGLEPSWGSAIEMGWWSHQQANTWCCCFFDIFDVYLTSIRTFFPLSTHDFHLSPISNPREFHPPTPQRNQKSMANSIPFPRSKHSGRRHGSSRKHRSSRMKMPMSTSNVPGEGTGLGTLAFQWPEGNVVEKL